MHAARWPFDDRLSGGGSRGGVGERRGNPAEQNRRALLNRRAEMLISRRCEHERDRVLGDAGKRKRKFVCRAARESWVDARSLEDARRGGIENLARLGRAALR